MLQFSTHSAESRPGPSARDPSESSSLLHLLEVPTGPSPSVVSPQTAEQTLKVTSSSAALTLKVWSLPQLRSLRLRKGPKLPEQNLTDGAETEQMVGGSDPAESVKLDTVHHSEVKVQQLCQQQQDH
ncbi:Hypothetical predicted protein [Xyrichtys novacula]|uniref:Uncharacterized protein n=1 Tax=Xyrichtys novacula TaxID=13765 RepID=A0AAV1H6S3_XYRNO|nr:Hypothetical predicted protein [Xyrichtys novacula]